MHPSLKAYSVRPYCGAEVLLALSLCLKGAVRETRNPVLAMFCCRVYAGEREQRV